MGIKRAKFYQKPICGERNMYKKNQENQSKNKFIGVKIKDEVVIRAKFLKNETFA
jgi:hypothetical protein